MLCPGDRECCGLEIDLGPLQVANLGRSQPVPECEQDHGLVAMRSAIALAALDQPLDFWLGQVLAGAYVGVPGAARGFDFPYLGVWQYDFQGCFVIGFNAPFRLLSVKYAKYGKLQWSFIGQSSPIEVASSIVSAPSNLGSPTSAIRTNRTTGGKPNTARSSWLDRAAMEKRCLVDHPH